MTPEGFKLAGKVAVVVGAAGGIGSSIARHFVEAGAKVVCVDRQAPEALSRVLAEAGGQAEAMACNITRAEETEALAARVRALWGRVDILVNSASADDPTADILALAPEV